jgi:energy-coupling factor transporter ATP-binding protein EcfA2
MTLEADLVEWAKGRPDWQKAALAAFCKNVGYTEGEIKTIADQLIVGTFPATSNLTVDDVPGGSSTGDRVLLTSLGEVAGVNALVDQQTLSFAETGLTVIYGHNASGKSGYARLLREAVTARVKGDLLGDVFSLTNVAKAAQVGYSVAGSPHTWSLGDVDSTALSSVRFYDVDCGEDYIETAAEITYRPYALTLLDGLQAHCRTLQAELDQRFRAKHDELPSLPALQPGTSAATFVAGLSKDTTDEQIKVVVELPADHESSLASKMQEEIRLRASDPNKEKARLTAIAGNLSQVRQHLEKLDKAVSREGVDDLVAQRKSAADLREAAKLASAEEFGDEPLTGVGSATWRALWEAARAYSTAEAFHEHEFPVLEGGAVCVLCQQPLTDIASERLGRFEKFVADTTSQHADQAEGRLRQRRDELALLQKAPTAVTTALAVLQSADEDSSQAVSWMTGAHEAIGGQVQWLEGALDDAPIAQDRSPVDAIKARQAEITDLAAAIDPASFNKTLSDLGAEVADMKAGSALAGAEADLRKTVEIREAKDRIDAARRQTNTQGITTKVTELTTTYVTALARDQFTRESDRLGLEKITLSPVRGRHNSTLEHVPELLGASRSARVSEVFSEGEQTTLGLAGFLTEVHFDGSKSSVILDDPVTSLDAGRRAKTARRLVELAGERQVIVFTHEITFVNELLRQGEELAMVITPRSVQRIGGKPGKVADKFPWAAQDVSQRIDSLAMNLAAIRKDQASLDEEDYTHCVRQWAGELSETSERALNLEIVNRVVDRGTNQVKPLMLKILPKFDQADHDEFQNGYSKASSWAPRHDNAPEENFQAPKVGEIERELERLKAWHAKIKAYKN